LKVRQPQRAANLPVVEQQLAHGPNGAKDQNRSHNGKWKYVHGASRRRPKVRANHVFVTTFGRDIVKPGSS
jgi:hypothetical protein